MTINADFPSGFLNIPKAPDASWLAKFLGPGLQAAKVYQIDHIVVTHKLDQNESPWDWPDECKDQVMQELKGMSWNRYPEAFPEELHVLIAQYYKIPRDNILVAPGSNHLLTLVINAFGRNLPGELRLARPSFPLYESHSRSMDIPYKTWDLNADLEYDESQLNSLPPGSLVVFASPNNPVGNSLSYERFEALLGQHPQSLFCADEAYFEYGEKPYTTLIEKYSNLIIIRTFSKTLSAAGIRLGLLIGHKYYIDQVQKLLLPFTINHFAYSACKVALQSPTMQKFFQRTISDVIAERQRVFVGLGLLAKSGGFQTKTSYANFFLLRFADDKKRQIVYQRLIEKGILLRDVSKGPGLSGCLRLSLGTREQNDTVLAALQAILH